MGSKPQVNSLPREPGISNLESQMRYHYTTEAAWRMGVNSVFVYGRIKIGKYTFFFQSCGGDLDGPPPYASNRHMGKCGFLTWVMFDDAASSGCYMKDLYN